MKQFDYVSAWREVAEPAYRALTPEAHALYAHVQEHGRGLSQDRYLQVPIPADLLARLEAMSDQDLADMAKAVYFFGHWGSKNESGPHGATWKLSNMADQVLTRRLLPHVGYANTGPDFRYGFRIHQGGLRLCAATAHLWTWSEFGPATADVRDHAEQRAPIWPALGRRARNQTSNDAEARIYADVASFPDKMQPHVPSHWRAWLDTDKYMREEVQA